MNEQVTGQPDPKGTGKFTDEPDRGGARFDTGPTMKAIDRVPGANEKVLFWASFFTLIAAGMGFSIRGDILVDWGRQFGFTQTELGIITGQGLAGFGITIIFFSFFADVIGYGKLMVVAFLLHATSIGLTLAAPFAYQQYGKNGAFYCLYLGAWAFSLGNGTCEAVINPLTATLFPKNKTHWLNILHAGWPGGLVLGALVSLGLNQIAPEASWVTWQVRWAIVFAPMLLYGVLMLGRRFPSSEAKESGISARAMMGEVGLLGAAVVCALLGLWFSGDIFPWLARITGLPASMAWLGWAAAGVLWIVFGSFSRFRIGHWMLAFLYIIHGLVGYVELGTDSWIVDITKTVLDSPDKALMAFIWTNVLMFTLRFFAGPIVHKISPVGLLFASAVLGTAGLALLGYSATTTTWLWLGAVTIYGLGKTFYWPTMLGVISERYPKGGALALGFSGGVGMLAAGLLGGPGIGYKQDYFATRRMKEEKREATFERYAARDDNGKLDEKSFLWFPATAGLDGQKVGVLLGDPVKKDGEPVPGTRKSLEADKAALEKAGRSLSDDKNFDRLYTWWQDVGRSHEEDDRKAVVDARLYGGKTALLWTALVPAAMAVGYLLLILYFRAIGGYTAKVLTGHAAEDERFTGGTEGPGEG
jgi:MFS family permease